MGLVYHARYLDYFEWARTEMIRSSGMAYDDLEKSGFFLPCNDAKIKFHKPAKYDELLHVNVIVSKRQGVRLAFAYEIVRGEEILVTGETTHVFTNSDFKPTKPPKAFALDVTES